MAAEITAKMVKDLRDKTDAGMMDCKKALVEAAGDIEKAVDILRKSGMAKAAKKSGRGVKEGKVGSKVDGKVGAMVEVLCETDFVARTDDFKTLAHDLALHIAFAAPDYLAREDVPEDVIERERAIYRAQALEEGKPERIVDRIVKGRMEKFYQRVCLMEQPFVKDEDKTIQDLITDSIAKLGENIVLRRFVRYKVGEGL